LTNHQGPNSHEPAEDKVTKIFRQRIADLKEQCRDQKPTEAKEKAHADEAPLQQAGVAGDHKQRGNCADTIEKIVSSHACIASRPYPEMKGRAAG
jgi:predicted ArsR family transcriptional regulator